ncbi:MAG: hypothetical protein ACYDH3_10125 [Candidatus Aminicenantales bacterium]
MPVKSGWIPGFVLGLGLVLSPLGAASRESGRPFLFQAGAGVEYFSRALAWDKDTGSSFLKAGLGLARFGIVFSDGPSLALLAGYALSDWNGLVFRQLPFSIDYEAGSIGGAVFGAEVDIPIAEPGLWEIGAGGRILFSLGSSGTWALSELNETGALDGKGRWTRVQFGPSVTYYGFETFSPYAAVYYDGLWGTFTMNEEIGILSGTEKKKILGQGIFGASLGVIIEPTSTIRLKAEGSLGPYTKLEGGLKLNAGVSLQARILF